MPSPNVDVIQLSDTGDQRGSSFPLGNEWLGFLGRAVDCHVMTIKPGQVRGNHYHAGKREVLIVVYRDRWSLCWDTGPSTSTQHRTITGSGAVMVKVAPSASHAIVNDGGSDLFVTALCSEPYDPSAPDSFPRVVTPSRT